MIGYAFGAHGAHALAALLLLGAATPALAQKQIVTAVESEEDVYATKERPVGSTPGEQVGTTYGGADTRALTDYGVNKIYSQGAAGYEQYASSAWLDTFMAAGAAGTRTTVTFNFTIDGMSSVGGPEYNFNVFAMRGSGWSIIPEGGLADPSEAAYDTLTLQQVVGPRPNPAPPPAPATLPGNVAQLNMRDIDGMYNYAYQESNPNVPGAFGSSVFYDETADVYVRRSEAFPGIFRVDSYYSDRLVSQTGANPPVTTFYSTPGAGNAPRQARISFENNYAILDSAQLCAGPDGCSNAAVFGPTTLTLSFEVLAGSSFTIASWLYLDDLTTGTIDFFNTAKVTGITVSDPSFTLTSSSNTLVAGPGGTYSFPAATAAVPEPGTWAMMIGGLGLIGGGMRARRRKVALA